MRGSYCGGQRHVRSRRPRWTWPELTLGLSLGLSLGLLVACDAPVSLDALPPPVASGTSGLPLPPIAVSVVDAPIALSLGPALAALESTVPRTFGDLDERLRHPGNPRQHFAFEASREPFRVTLEDGRLSIGTVVSYAGRGWYDPPLLPTVSASCGTEGPRPRVRARVETPLALTSDWALQTRTRLAALAPYSDTERDACRVTAFHIDVTDRVVDGVRSLLGRQLPQLDRELASWDIRSRLARWYGLLGRPIRVRDSLWLLLQPGAVRYGGLTLTDTALIADIRLFATPHLVSGAAPALPVPSLPPFDTAASRVGDSARILLEARLDYATASSLLRTALVGRSFSRWHRRVRVDDVRLVPVGDGRLAFGVRFSGALRGEGWLLGTPQVDPTTGDLTVPDLDFDVATGDALVRGLSFLRSGATLEVLRSAARLPLAGPLDDLRGVVEHAMNRELADGVHLRATLTSARVVDVRALPEAIVARAQTTGAIGLGIDRPLRATAVRGR